MKKFVFTCFVLFATLNISAQISFVGFDQPFCPDPMVNVYTYANYTIPGGPTTTVTGFKVFKNGIEVYDRGGSMGSGVTCYNLSFINDSTGFMVYFVGIGVFEVRKTSDYGVTWTSYIGGGMGTGYLGLYIVNSNYAYYVGSNGTPALKVVRCSDIELPTSPFINDDTVNTGVYKTDTIFGNSLCNIDSLNIFVKNNLGDTIDYHINITSVPLGIKERPANSATYCIYPNPSQNEISISGAPFSVAEVYTILGAKIVASNSRTINIEDFSNGVYIIKIIDLNGLSHNSRFIKE